MWVGLAACAACAAPGEAVDAAAAERVRARLARLTSPEFGGRATGTSGGAATRAFLVHEFEALGLRPLDGTSFEHAFSVRDPARGATPDSERTRLAFGSWQAELGVDAEPFGFCSEGDARGRCVFAGYGDYEGLDVAGAVVVLLRGAPGWRARRLDPEYLRTISFETKIAEAGRRGALAVLIVDDQRSGSGPIGAAARARGFAELPAFWVTREAAGRLWQRGALGGSLEEAQDRGWRGLLGPEVEFAVGFRERAAAVRTANLVGVVPPAVRSDDERWILVGAHFDHLGRGETSLVDLRHRDRLHPGADDNASGVVALLEVAARLVRDPVPECGVAFVAFGAEELGLAGSRAFVRDSTIPRRSIRAMVNLEMLGRVGESGLRIDGVGSASGWAALLDRAGAREAARRSYASPRSDHWPFLVGGVPAVVFHSGVPAEYHTPADVASLVDVAGVLRVSEIVARLVREIASSSDPFEFDTRVLRGSFLDRK